jgi:hypothetical protein
MKNITNPTWIKAKGILFLILGMMSSILLVLMRPNVTVILLLAVTVWSFCRFYYFAFYVIEKYVDSNFRYAGLLHLASYLIRKRNG